MAVTQVQRRTFPHREKRTDVVSWISEVIELEGEEAEDLNIFGLASAASQGCNSTTPLHVGEAWSILPEITFKLLH